MEFTKIHNVSKNQLYLILYARFIMIIICIQHIFSPKELPVPGNLMIDGIAHCYRTKNNALVPHTIQCHLQVCADKCARILRFIHSGKSPVTQGG